MDEFLIFLKLIPESVKIGLIYSIMVMGVYITYKILDFPDLSIDGTFPLGGFIFVAFAIKFNFHPFFLILLSGIFGLLAGYITALLHVKFKINKLLSGILTMTGLYSINARILGRPNAFLDDNHSWFNIISFDTHFYKFLLILILLMILKVLYDRRIKPNSYANKSLFIYLIILTIALIYIFISKDISMFLIILIVFSIKLILDYILTSKFGLILRALGNNEILVTNLGVDINKVKMIGLMISNTLVAISGAIFTQFIKIIDLSSSVGTLIIGLASIIFGIGLIKKTRAINNISIVIFGTITYYILINFALNSSSLTNLLFIRLGINPSLVLKLSIRPTDVKIITAIFLAIILYYSKNGGKDA